MPECSVSALEDPSVLAEIDDNGIAYIVAVKELSTSESAVS